MAKLAMQIYSVRDDYQQDANKAFKRTKELGYQGVELFGAITLYTAEFLKKSLAEHGLEIAGYHMPWGEFETEEKIQGVIAFMKELGCNYVVVPWMPEMTVEQWNEIIARFNVLCERFEKEGMRFGFHAHKGEMIDLSNGKCAWEMIGEGTSDSFIMQVDIGNVMNGGKDCVEMYGKFAAKGTTVHYKAFSAEKQYDCYIGNDDIDWKKIAEISKSNPCDWIIVEKDAQDDFYSLEKSIEFLRGII